jgi:hypothetical protein
MSLLLIGLACLISVIFSLEFGLRYIYDYKATKTGIEFKFFNKIVFYRIPYKQIQYIRIFKKKEYYLPNFHISFFNRLFSPAIIIEQKNFPFKIIVTPDEPHQFIKEVNKYKTI